MQRILDSANIVEVVSDFVSLKKRGANYIGLCPFHNERTPSFSVSPSKGICKCFSCGKGGSAVGFVMELEQMSYNEALRYLAKKYHIEIKETEVSPEERQRESDRETMLAVNTFALDHFRSNLTSTSDGRDIGLAYFRERGINDAMIEKFRLGYAVEKSDDLYKAAMAAGYDERFLIDTGLCARSERNGSIYDRFRGRVIYPVFSVSGRPIAFGGRTLRSDKSAAKYVNSPESAIYHKSSEVYGLYQAKAAIVKRNKCILVEGYMDVISMHQVGVENVVASSGTSLTDGQIRLINRFCEYVTVIYDSDAAGIKASLRGIDMLLAQGLNIKVVLLPDGDDPDSFAQSHSGTEVEEYITAHEEDFIRFKTRILLNDAKDDPIARARVISDIVSSIAVIPNNILQLEYIKECSRMLDVKEDALVVQLGKTVNVNLANKSRPSSPTGDRQGRSTVSAATSDEASDSNISAAMRRGTNALYAYEKELLKYVVKYGMMSLASKDGGESIPVIRYVREELEADGISFAEPLMQKIFVEVKGFVELSWTEDYEACSVKNDAEYVRAMTEGEEEIRLNGADLADIQNRERILKQRCDDDYVRRFDDFCAMYVENFLLSHPDDEIRRLTTDLACEKHVLSKVHTRYAHVETERERLGELVPRAVLELKLAILNLRIDGIHERIKEGVDNETALS
ncbi:MAG: DNA primase, partial [Muribaculaceae bacterium]|nr:DNA primase [Muribaculaceae bacterium]